MDVLLLFMGLTLAAAGWLLIRDCTQFLYSAYTARGKVVGIEPGYWPRHHHPEKHRIPGYFPIIEYYWNGESSRFTALIPEAVGTLQIGDQVNVQVSRSRRSKSRLGRGLVVLMSLLACLLGLLVVAAVMQHRQVGLAHVCLASLVLAVCLFVIVLYLRQQDESLPGGLPSKRQAAHVSLCLQEPTSPRHWARYRVSRQQRNRICYSRIFGGGCMAAAFVLVLASFHLLRSDWAEPAMSGLLGSNVQIWGHAGHRGHAGHKSQFGF